MIKLEMSKQTQFRRDDEKENRKEEYLIKENAKLQEKLRDTAHTVQEQFAKRIHR